MVVDLKENVDSLKDQLRTMTLDRDRTTRMYNNLYKEHEDLKAEKTEYYDSWRYALADIMWLEAQIKNLQTLEKDQELDEAKKEVEHLKSMLEDTNKKESTLTSQLKEKEKEKPNKWNNQDKGKQINSLKRNLKKPKELRMS